MPKKLIEGVVVAKKMNKTVVVEVNDILKHPVYEKRYVRSKKYFVHDENEKAELGQKVLIEECRPFSKHKTWTLVDA